MENRLLRGKTPHIRLRFLLLLLLFLAVFFGSFLLGRYPVGPVTICKLLLAQVVDIPKTWADGAANTFFQIRLPRVTAAALIGAALSVAGAAYQGLFRNPMVSPDILGASSGAGFGAALAIWCAAGYFTISLSAFLSGLVAVLLAYALGRASRINTTLSMVLSGMMVSSLFTAATSFLKLIADTDQVLPAITYWLMGSLSSIRQRDLPFLALPVLAGLVVLLCLRWRLNLLTVSDEEAESMGVNVQRLRAVVIVCATLMTAASVAVGGLIGWVGLVIPHFCRLLFGYDYRRLLPAAALMGASFLIVVDDVARLFTTAELPIGILTAFVGAPVFAWLILTGGAKHGN
jgi:iron complex transport system permease protein